MIVLQYCDDGNLSDYLNGEKNLISLFCLSRYIFLSILSHAKICMSHVHENCVITNFSKGTFSKDTIGGSFKTMGQENKETSKHNPYVLRFKSQIFQGTILQFLLLV